MADLENLDLSGWSMRESTAEDCCWICGAAYADCDCDEGVLNYQQEQLLREGSHNLLPDRAVRDNE